MENFNIPDYTGNITTHAAFRFENCRESYANLHFSPFYFLLENIALTAFVTDSFVKSYLEWRSVVLLTAAQAEFLTITITTCR